MCDTNKKNSQHYYDLMVSTDDDHLSLDAFINKRTVLGSREQVAMILGLKDTEILSRFELGKTKLKNATYTLFLLLSDSHPKYQLQKKQKGVTPLLILPPTAGAERKQYRVNANKLKQDQMAMILGLTGKSLISRYEKGHKNPSVQTWTIFLLATNQHPFFKLSENIV